MVNHYGLVGTFIINENMEIKTFLVNKTIFDKMLRRSLIYLLMWLQKTVFLSQYGYSIKQKFNKGILLNYDTNKRLIAFFETMNQKYKEVYINSIKSNYTIDDIIGTTIAFTKKNINKYILFVNVNHHDHIDIVPLMTINCN